MPLALILAALVILCAFSWPNLIFLPCLIFILWFFRDPKRSSDAPPEAFLSPADGKIVEISTVEEPEHIRGKAQKIAIFMSVFDVHVNRAPCNATIEWTRHVEGTFINALRDNAGIENERVLLAMRRNDRPVLLKLVAGLIARRIVCHLAPGDNVSRGRRIGMIRFGSRVEIFLPVDAGFEVGVKLGRHVRAGETVIGTWR